MECAYVGARKEIALVKESTRGMVANPAAGDWIPNDGYSFRGQVDKMNREAAIGRIEQTQSSFSHKKYGQGDINFALNKEVLGKVMTLIMGQSPTTTGPSGDIYTHTYAVKNTNCHQSYTIHTYDPIRGFLAYPLGALNTASFNLTTEEIPSVALNMYSKYEAASGATETSYSTSYAYPYWMPHHITYKIAADYGSLGAASNGDASEIGLEFNKNADYRYEIGSGTNGLEPTNIYNQRFAISGTFTRVFDDTELKDLAHSNAIRALRITASDSDGTILTLSFPRVTFKDWAEDEDLEAYMGNVVGFQPEYDTTNGLMIATLANKVSSY